MRYLVCCCYDGTGFYGYEKQKDKLTIQGEIERVLSKIFNQHIKIIGCSRTDRKVHAYNSFFHFDCEKNINERKFLYSMNSLINKSIYFKSIQKVSDTFHARYNVKEKEYLYKINIAEFNPLLNNYMLNYCKTIDIKLLKRASKHLVGKRDFRSFTSDREKDDYVRHIFSIKIKKKNNCVSIYIVANGFLRYMVRNIVGLLLDINEGKKQISDIDEILSCKDRTKLGSPALSQGLYLNKVIY